MFWFNGKKVKELPPEIAAYRKTFQEIIDEAIKREPVRDYNDLIPPSNPVYPWKAKGWQVLCYYCNEPITVDSPEAYYRQRSLSPRGWYHLNNSEGYWACDLKKVRSDIDLPHCHICGVRTSPHHGICSVAGPPSFHATSMSQKEEEVQQWAERERRQEMHDALFALLQEYTKKIETALTTITVSNEAIRRVLKASPWGHSIK